MNPDYSPRCSIRAKSSVSDLSHKYIIRLALFLCQNIFIFDKKEFKMRKDNILKDYFNTKSENILLEFDGALSQDLLIRIGDVIIKKVDAGKLIKTIFAVFVELAQNIMHYSAEKERINDKELGVGTILFAEDDDNFTIFSGNKIENSKVGKLVNHLELINSKDEAELKKFYKERLHSSSEQDSKGAGLGLIDIARKSKSKISYEVLPVDDNNSFIKINIIIGKDA
jgi:hypothetical protein